MNCRPGDLAVIVGCSPGCECNLGALVTVVPPERPIAGEWGFKDASRPLRCVSTMCDGSGPEWVTNGYIDAKGYWATLEDKHLRPLRDPGDDARDETLEWLPVPQEVTA